MKIKNFFKVFADRIKDEFVYIADSIKAIRATRVN